MQLPFLIASISMLLTAVALWSYRDKRKSHHFHTIVVMLYLLALFYAAFDFFRYLGFGVYWRIFEFLALLMLPLVGLYYWRYGDAL